MLEHLRTWLFPPVCAACEAPGPGLCAACAPAADAARTFDVHGVPGFALGDYDGNLRRAIVAMKHGVRDPLDAFAELLAARAPLRGTLVPLPTSRGRAAQRGFDQSVELAARLGRCSGLSVAHVLVKRGAPQAGRTRSERLHAGSRFRLCAHAPSRVTLIDDVVTTGATAGAAIEVLRGAGVAVEGLTVLARTAAVPRLEPSRSAPGR